MRRRTLVLIDMDRTIFKTDQFLADYQNQAPLRDYWYADAKKFMDKIRQKPDYQTYIFSYGQADWQTKKYNQLGIDEKLILTSSEQKTADILALLEDGQYVADGQKFTDLIFVDDKVISFEGFYKLPNARGYLLRRSPSDQPRPKKVQIIKSFDDITL